MIVELVCLFYAHSMECFCHTEFKILRGISEKSKVRNKKNRLVGWTVGERSQKEREMMRVDGLVEEGNQQHHRI